MRVIVAGGRGFSHIGVLFQKLDELHEQSPITIIIHGGARGADAMAGKWCEDRLGVAPIVFPAKWNTHKIAAGPIRNQQMIDEGMPDLVVLFPGGNGTRDMERRAKSAGIPTIRYEMAASIEDLF